MFTEEINKVALSINDNKRIQPFDKATHFHKKHPPLKFVEMKC